MLIAASFALGLFPDLWPLPILAGLVGEIAHFASSRLYRRQMLTMPGAQMTAVLFATTLSAICVTVFWIGSWVWMLLV